MSWENPEMLIMRKIGKLRQFEMVLKRNGEKFINTEVLIVVVYCSSYVTDWRAARND